MNSIPRQVLTDLGALHHASAWESSVLAAALRGKGIEVPDYALVDFDEPVPSLVPAIPSAGADAVVVASTSVPNEGNGATSLVNSKGLAKQGGPQEWNAAALTRIIRGIPNTLAPFYQGIRLCLF